MTKPQYETKIVFMTLNTNLNYKLSVLRRYVVRVRMVEN